VPDPEPRSDCGRVRLVAPCAFFVAEVCEQDGARDESVQQVVVALGLGRELDDPVGDGDTVRPVFDVQRQVAAVEHRLGHAGVAALLGDP
jgi:hypothetical protein